jgi:hypothetical protein
MDLRAIPPYRFVCTACGKTSATHYGFDPDHDPGWDAACTLHAMLCKPVEGEPGTWNSVTPEAGVNFKPEAWDQSDGVECPTCGGDFTLCEHGNELCAESGNGCATVCIRCGAQVPDLGPLKTPYVCDDCKDGY